MLDVAYTTRCVALCIQGKIVSRSVFLHSPHPVFWGSFLFCSKVLSCILIRGTHCRTCQWVVCSHSGSSVIACFCTYSRLPFFVYQAVLPPLFQTGYQITHFLPGHLASSGWTPFTLIESPLSGFMCAISFLFFNFALIWKIYCLFVSVVYLQQCKQCSWWTIFILVGTNCNFIMKQVIIL